MQTLYHTHAIERFEMKKRILLALSVTMLVSVNTFAQGITRVQVRQELVQAEQNGSQLVTDASYPDVSPVYQAEVAKRAKPDAQASTGGIVAGSGASGIRQGASDSTGCVGPRSYCDLYAGS
jgi:hypothetical protein